MDSCIRPNLQDEGSSEQFPRFLTDVYDAFSTPISRLLEHHGLGVTSAEVALGIEGRQRDSMLLEGRGQPN
jgi:hypothetical protein